MSKAFRGQKSDRAMRYWSVLMDVPERLGSGARGETNKVNTNCWQYLDQWISYALHKRTNKVRGPMNNQKNEQSSLEVKIWYQSPFACRCKRARGSTVAKCTHFLRGCCDAVVAPSHKGLSLQK